MTSQSPKSLHHRPADWRLLPAFVLLFSFCLITTALDTHILNLMVWLLIALLVPLLTFSVYRYRQGPVLSGMAHRSSAFLLHTTLVCILCIPVAIGQADQKQGWEDSGLPRAVQEDNLVLVQFQLTATPQSRTNQFGAQTYSAPASITRVIHAEDDPTTFEPGSVEWPIWLTSSQDMPYPSGTLLYGRIQLAPARPMSRIQAYGQLKGPAQTVQTGNGLPTRNPDPFENLRTQLRVLGQNHQTGISELDNSHHAQRGRALIPSMIVGDVQDHDEQLREDMKISGLSHLSAVSGANCALVFGAVTHLLRRFHAPRTIQFLAAFSALVIFVLVVGTEPSVMRAAVMGLVGGIAVFSGRGRQTLPLLFVAGLGLLLFDPWYATDLAFQLSVAATWGIIWWATPVTAMLKPYLPEFLAQAFAVSVAAQFATTPVLGPATGSLPTHSVLANILVTPLVPAITLLGTASLPFALFLPEIAAALLYPVGFLTFLVGLIGGWAAALPLALIPWPEGTAGYVLGFAVLVGFAWTIHHISRLNLRNRTQEKEHSLARILSPSRAIRPWPILTIVAVLLLVLATRIFLPSSLPKDWDVAMCDVGQGEMLVMNISPHQVVIIDTGPEPELATKCLKSLDVEHVAEVFITHQHSDHHGGLKGITQNYPVSRITYSSAEENIAALQEAAPEIPFQEAEPGMQWNFSAKERTEDIQLTIISADSEQTDENNASIVAFVKFSSHHTTMLLTGDVEEDSFGQYAERLPEHVDILSVPHHGARNGGTQLHAVLKPSVALISAGRDNSYGHPHPEIIDSLHRHNTQVLRTDSQGSIWLKFHDGVIETGTF